MTDPKLTPPPELVQQWLVETLEKFGIESHYYIATRAAQWGADMELEACCEWLEPRLNPASIDDFYAARRPKPPSLKELALARLAELESDEPGYWAGIADIRLALEALPND